MKSERKTLGGWSQLRRVSREMRDGKWLANAQSRSRASKTVWDLLVFPISFAIWLALWLGGVQLGIALMHALKPSITGASIGFGVGPMKLAGFVLLLSPIIAAIASAFWVANTIVYSIPQAKRAQIAKTGESGLMEAQAGLLVATMLGCAGYVVLLATAILLT